MIGNFCYEVPVSMGLLNIHGLLPSSFLWILSKAALWYFHFKLSPGILSLSLLFACNFLIFDFFFPLISSSSWYLVFLRVIYSCLSALHRAISWHVAFLIELVYFLLPEQTFLLPICAVAITNCIPSSCSSWNYMWPSYHVHLSSWPWKTLGVFCAIRT